MTTDLSWVAVALAVATAVAAGLVGCFAVMRRMALASDALSHVALPGIGLAIAFHVHPLFGAIFALFCGSLLVWALEEQTRIPTDTIIGVVFSAALAVGSMMTSGEDLIEVLFGRTGEVSRSELLFGLAAAALVVGFVLRERHRLVVALVSPDMARTSGVNVRRLNLGYLLMFALTVALGLRHLGVLLMGSLIIIPAATARRLATHLSQMLALSAAIAAVVTVAGFVLAAQLHRQAGPVIVTIAAAVFALTFLRRKA
jgi:ABC-type Mn2+/Zn2+ transport system permease subunit